jgi:general secretion pathway protein H
MRYLYRGGFTLLEIIMVLFIVGLASSLVMFYFSKTYEKTSQKEQIRRIKNMLSYARNTALMEREIVVFHISEDGKSLWLKKGDSTLSTLSLPKEMKAAGDDNIAFFPKGDSTGGSITIDAAGKKYEIKINPITSEAVLKP